MQKQLERHPALDAKIVSVARKLPEWWIQTILGCHLWVKQIEIARSVFWNTRTSVRAAEGVGKSYVAARTGLCFLMNHRPATVVTTAPTNRQVEDILWREIANAHANSRVSLPGEVMTKKLEVDKDWFAIGFSTNLQENWQGIHNENILIIGDEASGLEELAYKGMENPMATGNARMLLIGNPSQPAGGFRDSHSSSLFNCIHISAFDSPNFTAFGITIEDIRSGAWKDKVAGRDMPYPSLTNPQRVAERYEQEGEGSYSFQVFVMGNFPDAGVNNLIPLHLIEEAMARKPDDNDKSSFVAAVDVSRYGDDETVFALRRGNNIPQMTAWGHQDTMYTAGRCARYIKDYKVLVTRVDSVGVGGGVADRLKEVGARIEEVNVGEKALDSERFANKRSEYYFHLLKRLEDGELNIFPDKKLKAQLSDIRYKYDSRGKLQLETKEEMRARGSKSPDRADALMMLCMPLKRTGGAPPVWRW